MEQLNCLVACEQSQEVTEQIIMLGHKAMSCDIEYDGAKGLPHYKGDVRDLLQERYDLVIFHPVCRYIANSGVRWLYNEDGRQDTCRWLSLIDAIMFFNLRHEFNSDYVGTENPIPHKYAVNGIADKIGIGKYDQCFQPWHFGHEKMKATCLWLKGLPKLEHTNIVGPPPKDKKERQKWQDVWMASPGPDRERLRSVTYTGIAEAMAKQWTEHILHIRTTSAKLVIPIQNINNQIQLF